MPRRVVIAALAPAACLAVACAAVPAYGQPTFSERWQSAAPKTATTDAPAVQNKLPVSLEQALYLIRSTLLALNDANRSGNYTVLRDLAAPEFQTRNSAANLALIFSDLRDRKVDLYAVALMAPQLSAPPRIERGMLRLNGAFPTRPLQIAFDLLFENVGAQWRLFGISVQTPQAQTASH